MQVSVDSALADLQFLPRLFIALALTAALGWDRELKQRPAGLRTHMLVGISACSFVIIGELFVERFGEQGSEFLRFDPIRIVEATVAGVSFLGAGTVFIAGANRVLGLTTAGTLLASAAVGMLVALERYVLAVAMTALILLVVSGLYGLEVRLNERVRGDNDDSKRSP